MSKGKWFRTALLSSILCSTIAVPAMAGEWQFGARLGNTRLEVDGDRLSSGDDVNDRLLSSAITVGYRWTNGLIVEAGGSGSSSFFEFLGINTLDHYWLGAGWQFDLDDRWRLTPKAGLVVTTLRSQEEDFFEGNEPTDELNDTVPFLEVSIGRRLGKHFFLGVFARQNFEDFGSSQMIGLQVGLNFE